MSFASASESRRFQVYFENTGSYHRDDPRREIRDALSQGVESVKEHGAGWVYVLSNESMPNILKIGMTQRDVESRMRELRSTGVPTPFALELKSFVRNVRAAEKYIHDTFRPYRVSPKSEFFRVPVYEVKAALISFDCHHSVDQEHLGQAAAFFEKDDEPWDDLANYLKGALS